MKKSVTLIAVVAMLLSTGHSSGQQGNGVES